ncbi:hypothetical protein KPL78_02990 [Roseomonas sp. HJA6]|uniref:VapC45 PIN like domain-containing protein n=1 Tax=Roseomonas alba TaxID=2846776 RepID=A0ABS7A3A8_9PROT|nr:hypothetical protein [Neoroseomonas alba]MBW6396793.1 hypothetical protein [Neoroseomonas alba]
MKIAFDEHVPGAVPRLMREIITDRASRHLFRGIEIVSAKDYAPRPNDSDYVKNSDAPWIKRYRDAGGRIIVSGDVSMNEKPAELLALIENKQVVFYFPTKWNSWKFPRKSAFLLVWFERIIKFSRTAKPRSLYRIPERWSDDADFLIINTPTPLKLSIRGPLASASSVKKAKKNQKIQRSPAPEPQLLAMMRRPAPDASTAQNATEETTNRGGSSSE